MPMGGGIPATNEPKASLVSCHTSTSIPFGCGSVTRSRAGFGGVVLVSAKRRYFGAVVVVRSSDAPRLELVVQRLPREVRSEYRQLDAGRLLQVIAGL